MDILGEYVGKAYELGDVAEFCRCAGLDELDLDAEYLYTAGTRRANPPG